MKLISENRKANHTAMQAVTPQKRSSQGISGRGIESSDNPTDSAKLKQTGHLPELDQRMTWTLTPTPAFFHTFSAV